MTATDTETKLQDPCDHWPPLAHIARTPPGTVKKGDEALCGAKLMGLDLDDAHKVCEKCLEILKEELS